MTLIYLLLLLAALVCFILAAAGVPVRRISLVALGLAFWVAVPLLQTIRALD
jgi:hypothetical protein